MCTVIGYSMVKNIHISVPYTVGAFLFVIISAACHVYPLRVLESECPSHRLYLSLVAICSCVAYYHTGTHHGLIQAGGFACGLAFDVYYCN